MKHQEPEAIGEAVYMSHGGNRALELKYSWGMGVEAWEGPVVFGYPSSSSSGSHLLSDTPPSSITDEVPATSPSPRCATATTRSHSMNPEAVEFCPGSAVDEEHKTQTESSPSPGQSSGISFPNQYSGNMQTESNPSPSQSSGIYFPNQYPGSMFPNEFYGTHVNPMAGIPFAHDTTGCVWNPYTQGWEYRTYNMQPWEIPGLFNNFQTYNYWGSQCF